MITIMGGLFFNCFRFDCEAETHSTMRMSAFELPPPPSQTEQVERKGTKEDITPEQKEKLEKVLL